MIDCMHFLKNGWEGVTKLSELPTVTRKSILDGAIVCTCTDRNEQYGEPEDNFKVIADMWSTYITGRYAPPGTSIKIYEEDAAVMLSLFKIARFVTAQTPKADTFIDIAGYAACAGEIALRK
jgi:hypothetical protein